MNLVTSVSRRRQSLLAFAVVFLALVLRVSYFGFEYYYQLDDYIHFRQLAPGTDIIRLCIEGGYFSSRPMAVLSDFVIWSPMNHFLAVLVISAMYAGAAVIYWNVFRRSFGTGWLFVVCFTLLPLGFEGTYWLAASTRIVPPLLFSAVALWCLDRFVETKRYWMLAVYVISSLASFVLYEQLLVLSLALSLMLMLLRLMKKQWHALWALTVFCAVAAYLAFTGHFSVADSSLGSRMNVILPWHEGYFTTFLPSLLRQMRMAFVEGGWLTLGKGAVRGLSLIFSEHVWLAIGIPVVSFFVWRFAAGLEARKGSSGFWTPVFGFLAFLAPLTPFFIIANPWFSLRNAVPSFLGLALMLDWLVRKLTRERTAVICAVAACVCLTASVSELYDYRMTTRSNERVAMAAAMAGEDYALSGSVGILGLNQTFLEDQNYQFHDHIIGSHASDWALNGMVNYYTGSYLSYSATPLDTSGEVYFNVWSETAKDPNRFDQLLLYDHETGSMALLSREAGEDGTMLFDENGVLRARIWKDASGYGRIEFYPAFD